MQVYICLTLSYVQHELPSGIDADVDVRHDQRSALCDIHVLVVLVWGANVWARLFKNKFPWVEGYSADPAHRSRPLSSYIHLERTPDVRD